MMIYIGEEQNTILSHKYIFDISKISLYAIIKYHNIDSVKYNIVSNYIDTMPYFYYDENKNKNKRYLKDLFHLNYNETFEYIINNYLLHELLNKL